MMKDIYKCTMLTSLIVGIVLFLSLVLIAIGPGENKPFLHILLLVNSMCMIGFGFYIVSGLHFNDREAFRSYRMSEMVSLSQGNQPDVKDREKFESAVYDSKILKFTENYAYHVFVIFSIITVLLFTAILIKFLI